MYCQRTEKSKRWLAFMRRYEKLRTALQADQSMKHEAMRAMLFLVFGLGSHD